MTQKISEDNLKVGKKAISKYIKYIQPTDLEICLYNGIHDALMTHDPAKGRISTHIYNVVTYNCQNFIRRNNQVTNYDFSYSENRSKSEYENQFDPAFIEILIDYYVYKLPIEFIAEKYNVTVKGAKRKIYRRKKLLKKLVEKKNLLKG